jgi:hypothetical protein
VQHGIRRVLNPLDPHLAIAGMKQGENLGRAIAKILVVLLLGLAFGVPTGSHIRHGLKRPGFILTPHGNPHPLGQTIGVLN